MIISVLSALSLRPEHCVSLLYSLNTSFSVESQLVVITAMSSAYASVLIMHPGAIVRGEINMLLSIFLIRGSIDIINNAQLKASPCFTPLLIENGIDICPFTCTSAFRFELRTSTLLIKESGKLYALSTLLM